MEKIEPAYFPSTPDEVLSHLGAICVVWSQFEMLVEHTLNHVQSVSFDEGRLLKRPENISRRLRLLTQLASDRLPPQDIESLNVIMAQGEVLALRRNVAVHGTWGLNCDRPGHCGAISWFKVPRGSPLSTIDDDDLP